MEKRIAEKINTIIASLTNLSIDELDPQKDLKDQIDLDSMQFVAIAARIEEELKIEIPISIMNVKSLNDFFEELDLLLRKT